MWDEGARAKYARKGLRYASDATDEEWGLIEPLLPPAQRLDRPRTTAPQVIVDALLYIAATGCQWRLLPKDFPPHTTVQRYFHAWRDAGLLEAVNHLLVMLVREPSGRGATPTAGFVDSQSVKTTEAGGPRGYDAGKKIKGRKRHIVTDTAGNQVGAVVHPADVQDRDGAPLVLATIRRLCPWLRHVFADGGCAGDKLKTAMKRLDDRDRQAVGRRQGLRSPAQALGGGADFRLARPLPAARQGLREVRRQRDRLDLPRQR